MKDGYYERVIQPQLHRMHCAPSLEIMLELAEAAMREWRKEGYGTYCEWLANSYLSKEWCGWWCGASGVPGAGPTNNPLEAMNKDIKTITPEKCSMLHFVECAFPKYLLSTAQKRCPPSVLRDTAHNQRTLIAQGVLPRAVVQRAIEITEANAAIVTFTIPKTDERRFLVNSSVYASELITEERKKQRKAPATVSESFSQLHKRRCSLHTIQVAVKPGEDDFYRCDCKAFCTTGYLCAHIVAAYQFDDLIDIYSTLRGFSGPRKSGRPPKRSKGLVNDAVMEPSAASTVAATSSGNAAGPGLSGATIRGVGKFSGFLSGLVGKYDSKNKSFQAVFPDAPGEQQQVVLSEEEAQQCYSKQQLWVEEQKKIVMRRK